MSDDVNPTKGTRFGRMFFPWEGTAMTTTAIAFKFPYIENRIALDYVLTQQDDEVCGC